MRLQKQFSGPQNVGSDFSFSTAAIHAISDSTVGYAWILKIAIISKESNCRRHFESL